MAQAPAQSPNGSPAREQHDIAETCFKSMSKIKLWRLTSPPMSLGVRCNACDLSDACAPSSIFGPTTIATARGLTLTHGCLVGASPLEVLAAPILLAIRPGLDPVVMSRRAIVCGGGDFTPAVAAFPVDVAAPGFLLFR